LSIIYDALKKLEKNVAGNIASKGNENTPRATGPKKSNKQVLVFILIILIALSSFKIASNLFGKPKLKPSAMLATVISHVPLTPPSSVSSEEEPAVNLIEPKLILSGLYFQGDEGYALINNRIVKVGDIIQGARVKEIGLDKVALEFDGRIISLTNSGR
jgi:hypothetical protein